MSSDELRPMDDGLGPIEDGFSEAPARAPVSGPRWRIAPVLLVVSVLGTVAIMPFTISLLRQAKDTPITPAMTPVIVVISCLIEGALSLATIALGVGLGRRAGLGPFLLDGLDTAQGPGAAAIEEAGPGNGARALRALVLASAIGAVLGVAVIGLSYAFKPVMPDSPIDLKMPPPWECLLASVGAGIREEVWLRLGLMTLLAWLGSLVVGRAGGSPGVIWTANVLAALAFGAMHLPQAAMLIGLSPALVAFVFVGNGVPGIAFGWLFWRKGLIAAMVSHFMLDLVMKVIIPAVTG